jgi:hypothetical protein
MKALILTAAALMLVGCDRTHLSQHFGKRNRQAFATQVIDPRAGQYAKPTYGLDPEEAAIIADSYRKSLAPSKKEPAKAPILVIGEEEQTKMPAPMGGPK